MTTWTSPLTLAQKKYLSKRKGKLKAYEMGCLGVQVVWAWYDYPAYKALFDAAFEYVPSVAFMSGYLAGGLLIMMHFLLKETYTTYWFDKLDDDEKTDSSIWIPIVLMIALFVAGRYGIQMSIEKRIPPPVIQGTEQVDAVKSTRMAELEDEYNRTEKRINAQFDSKAAAAALKIDAEISSLKRRSPKTWEERGVINGMISKKKTQRASIVGPIEAARADSLASTLAYFDTQKRQERGTHNRATSAIETLNTKNTTKHEVTMGTVSLGSWFISALFVLLYAALGYAIVRIKVNSGILPSRHHTVLDQYGGVFGRLLYVIQDAFNRQFYRLTIFIHRITTMGTSTLAMMDSTIMEAESDYNTATEIPKKKVELKDAENELQTEEEALEAKVARKLVQQAKDEHRELYDAEMKKAKEQNGSYLKSDLGKSEPPAEKPAPAGGMPHPTAETTPSFEKALKSWTGRVQVQVDGYDHAIQSNDIAQAKVHEHYINNPNAPIRKEAKRLGIQYGIQPGQNEIMVWLETNPDNKVPLSKVTEAALKQAMPNGDGQFDTGEEESLFKQDLNLFKQTIKPLLDDEKKVIGVRYQKKDGKWVSYPRTQVEAYLRNYTQRLEKSDSNTNKIAFEMWKYALDLFNNPVPTTKGELEAIVLE